MELIFLMMLFTTFSSRKPWCSGSERALPVRTGARKRVRPRDRDISIGPGGCLVKGSAAPVVVTDEASDMLLECLGVRVEVLRAIRSGRYETSHLKDPEFSQTPQILDEFFTDNSVSERNVDLLR